MTEGQEVKVKLLEVDQRGKVRLSMRLVDQETGAELEDTRPPREPREGGDRGPRGDGRGPRRDGGDVAAWRMTAVRAVKAAVTVDRGRVAAARWRPWPAPRA